MSLSEWLEQAIAERTSGEDSPLGPPHEQGAADMSAGMSYQRRDEYGYSRVPGNRYRDPGYSGYSEPQPAPSGGMGDLQRRIEDAERRQFAAIEQSTRRWPPLLTPGRSWPIG